MGNPVERTFLNTDLFAFYRDITDFICLFSMIILVYGFTHTIGVDKAK